MSRTRVLILGGGCVGLYVALTLERTLGPSDADVTLVSPVSFMTYQSLLPEAASGSLEPRHVVIPLRSTLRRTEVLVGRATRIDTDARRVTIAPLEGPPYELGYDHLVVGVGSVSRLDPVPGLTRHAIGFKTVSEAIYLRNQVIARLEAAESTDDAVVRERALTFVFVGAGYAGVEAVAELESLARDACRGLHRVRPEDMRWILVEARDRILPELDPGLGAYAGERLRERGIDVRLRTTVTAIEDHVVRLSDGTEVAADTIVWTAGVRAQPLVADLGAELDRLGRVPTDRFLRVPTAPRVWAAGDCAAVPDPTGGTCPPTAQHALRQAKLLGANVAATIRGRRLRPFTYRNLGLLVSMGNHQGVATIAPLHLNLRGPLAWFLHRTYHLSRVPTLGRKARIALDWAVALMFRRDVVQLGTLRDPGEQMAEAAAAAPPPPPPQRHSTPKT